MIVRVLIVEPERKPVVREIDDTLEAMQKVVGGWIQALYPFEEPVALVANDEGKLLGLPMNRGLRDEDGSLYDIVFGTFFICGLSEENFASLTDEQIQKFQTIFAIPEIFVTFDGHLMILPIEDDAL